ncbi:MAG TPA: HK97 family phage prohead protease [Gemmatimonadota bacterium]|nr:HK97 family phage prohead protease [Gemmatimonadota bacterium]
MSTVNASAEAGVSVAAKPPRENLIRAEIPGPQIRAAEDGGMPTLFGHFAVFNRWTEINSWFEGHFLERLVPGAFKKTISENRDRIKALFQHGMDPQVGDKPLGPIDDLREDETGGYYEVPLLDTAYNRELVPGLEKGLYGASFRFEVMREEIAEEPGESKHNPRGLPERTIREVRLHEFGPVTFPAYSDATAGVRSLTDHFVFEEIARDPARFRGLLAVDLSQVSRHQGGDDDGPLFSEEAKPVMAIQDAPSETDTPPSMAPVAPERRETGQTKPMTRREWESWIRRI